VPVTAKLSRRFYEQFGDEIVNELVNLLNSVESGSRSDLRELNDLNFARFDAKLEQRVSGLRGEMQALKADLIKWMFLFWSGTALAGLVLR